MKMSLSVADEKLSQTRNYDYLFLLFEMSKARSPRKEPSHKFLQYIITAYNIT